MGLSIREYGLLALGLLAAAWFFVMYPSQDPRSAVDLDLEKNEVQQQAEQTLQRLGYAVQEFEAEVNVGVNRELLDTLQQKMGRQELIEQLKKGAIDNLGTFYWEVVFHPTDSWQRETDESSVDESEGPPGSDEETIELRFSMQGDFMELLNPHPIMPAQVVNRSALASIFGDEQEEATQRLATITDSLLVQQFIIDVQRNGRPIEDQQETTLSRLEDALESERPFLLFEEDVFNMASYYLDQTGWELSILRRDTVRMGRVNDISTATIRYEADNSAIDQQQRINVRLTAAGGIINISSAYQLGNEGASFNEIWPVLRTALIFLFCLAGIIIFFFRIRARAIDTKPALVVAILGGSAAAISMLLLTIPQVNFFTDPTSWTESFMVLIGIGIVGAAASLAFFVFSAIGDSITRQYWPEKLGTYDYLRQGMIFNKPIGYMVVRSVILAFILAGLWTLMLWLLPTLYIDIEQVFLQESAPWAPFYLMLNNSWSALGIVLGIFLVLGGQVYAQTKNKITSSVLMVLACTIVAPLVGSYGPDMQEFIVAAVIGLVLVLIYLRWEAMTLLLSYFLFLGLIRTSTGWIVDQSLDNYIFVFFVVVLGLLFIFGIWAALQGKEEKTLTEFVPDYVEELAQEERIKQELHIAREVQESFLPVKTPEFEHLELAAICKPAYETGGDYYDVIRLDDHRIAVTIGDVSGKGIQAAFYMTFIKGILHSLCREIESPAELLKKTNRIFCENAARGVFISLVYGIIDLEKQEFHFARAGHNPILRVNGQTGSVSELQPRGLGIGLAIGHPFDSNIEETKLELDKEDLLILYTDGIVEALNENHTFYGSHRFNNLLVRHSEASAANILEAISEDINSYIGNAKQHDDMTMIVIKLKK